MFSREIPPPPRFYHSFTLLELLIVIGILAVLASVTFIVLNPSEQLKKTRDSRRLADLKSLDKAIGIYESQTMSPSTGSSTKIYLSLPDTSSTCSSYSLPPAPPSYSYACVTEANLRKTNGSGWVPIEFSSIAIGSPLSVLPVDPINNNQYYYTYVTGGSYQLTALSESTGNKVSDMAISDGGRMPGTFEIGTDLSLGPFTRDNGLVGYWTFDEGTGTTAYDYSGNSNTGTLTNGPVWQTSSNCKKGGCLSFDGVNDYINVPTSAAINHTTNGTFSISIWVKPNTLTSAWRRGTIVQGSYLNSGYRLGFDNGGAPRFWTGQNGGTLTMFSSTAMTINQWNHVIVTYNNQQAYLYLNGQQVGSATGTYIAGTNAFRIGALVSEYYSGYLDDVLIYNRALSADEIQAIYNTTR